MEEDLRLKSLKEVAAIVGRNKSTIHRWLKLGYFPEAQKRLGGKPYWIEKQVVNWINEKQISANESKQTH